MRRLRYVLLGSGLVTVAALMGLLWVAAPERAAATVRQQAKPAPTAKTTSLGLKVTPLPDWFKFQSKDTVNGWIKNDDYKAITVHAWELWAALTTLTNQKVNGERVPVFETWWDAEEALLPATKVKALKATPGVRRFRRPVQFQQLDLARALTALPRQQPPRPFTTLFDIVKYNDDIKEFIADNHYNDHATLNKINSSWPANTPVAQRKLKDFPDTSVMLKPVFIPVSGSAITILPYWAGPVNSTSPATPADSTWTKKMVLVPPAVATPMKLRLMAAGEDLPQVKVDDFYHIKLTKDQAAELGPPVKEGDYMLLVAMHVSSREIDNWTWQTFWWSFTRPGIPRQVKKRVKAPFDHYQVATGYSFMTGHDDKGQDNPNSLPTVCYNPYLEAGFGNAVFVRPNQLGIESNCMSCHRCAAWPARTTAQPRRNYVANGLIDPGDPSLFGDKTKTDFLWGVADGRSPPQQ
jgi:hypothetical protein